VKLFNAIFPEKISNNSVPDNLAPGELAVLCATGIAGANMLSNAVANLAVVGLPLIIGYIKEDQTSGYDYSLLMVAEALILGGLLGLSLALKCATQPVARIV
jgi:hypothetical protein